MDKPKDTLQSDNKDIVIKAYISPKLIEYGGLHELTQSVGKTGNADGGVGASMNRSQP
ncbi:MAG TPA: hypothetical protein PLK30_25090 [Blastocatellia bacterium]|nr:hypothetical protein [Blastocatellia bacterium]